jgi:hypothetical protein
VVRNIESSGYDAANESQIFPLLMLQAVLPPSTGFWNMMVYLRPRYLRCHEDFPSESRLWAFRRAVCGALVGPESTTTFAAPKVNRHSIIGEESAPPPHQESEDSKSEAEEN